MNSIAFCRSCSSHHLTNILSLGTQYLADFREDDQLPPQYPLDLVLCTQCHLLQLKHTTPPLEMYNDNYGFKSGINDTIKADLAEIVQEALINSNIEGGDYVLDTGCNDGTLLSNYPKEYVRIGIEPVQKLAKQADKHASLIINDFFRYEGLPKQVKNKKVKIITSISMFYDLDDPNKFVGDIAKILAPDGFWVIQQNYLVGMLTQNAFDNIVHEHLEYYSLLSLESLLRRHGLEVFHVELNDINGGSFRTYVRHTKDQEVNFSVLALRQAEQLLKLDKEDIYKAFASRIKAISEKIHNTLVDIAKEGKMVYCLAASTRGNTLLQACNLDNELVMAAIERNPEKVGKKLASLQIPILSEEQARKDNPDYMLVLPWFFEKEIVERENAYLEKGGKILVPLPYPKIVTKDKEVEI